MPVTNSKLAENVGGFAAHSVDKFGIAVLLEQAFRCTTINLSDLADFLIGQSYVGSVIKPIDDAASVAEKNSLKLISGVISMINLKENKDLYCVKQIVDLLKEKVAMFGEDFEKDYINNLFRDECYIPALLIKERMQNVSAKLMFDQLVSLKNDIRHALVEGKPFNSTQIIQIFPMGKSPNGVMLYVYEEDEISVAYAAGWFDYPLPGAPEIDIFSTYTGERVECEPYRRVVIMPTFVYVTAHFSELRHKVFATKPDGI